MTASNGLFMRFRRRLKYGLLTQEILDRLAKVGLVCYPYYIVCELPLPRPELDAYGNGLEARFLTDKELTLVSSIPERPREHERIRHRLENGKCFGVWVDGNFAAYSWYSGKAVPTIIGAQPLCPLPEKNAYLYDAFVRPEFRGRQVAGFMRHKLHQALAEDSTTRCVSLSLAFNRSTRRFKARLGAEETELRLLLSIKPLGGFDFRLRLKNKVIPTPRVLRVRRSTVLRT